MGSVAELWIVKTFGTGIPLIDSEGESDIDLDLTEEYEYYNLGYFTIDNTRYIVDIIPRVEWDLWALLWSEEHLFKEYIEELEELISRYDNMTKTEKIDFLDYLAEKVGLKQRMNSDII